MGNGLGRARGRSARCYGRPPTVQGNGGNGAFLISAPADSRKRRNVPVSDDFRAASACVRDRRLRLRSRPSSQRAFAAGFGLRPRGLAVRLVRGLHLRRASPRPSCRFVLRRRRPSPWAVLGLGSRASSPAGEIALVFLVRLEVGLVPAAAFQAKHRRRDQPLHRLLLAAGALPQRRHRRSSVKLRRRTCSCVHSYS